MKILRQVDPRIVVFLSIVIRVGKNTLESSPHRPVSDRHKNRNLIVNLQLDHLGGAKSESMNNFTVRYYYAAEFTEITKFRRFGRV
jgi:hypothetical protein